MEKKYEILSTRKLVIGYKKNELLPPQNLSLYRGEMVCLIGQNGCGKSTLIRTLSGLQVAISGDVTIKEKKISQLNNAAKAKLIGLVLTDSTEIRSLTVRDMVSMGRFPHTNWFGKLNKKDEDIISQSIEKVHLTNKSDNYFSELSDGEKQRTLIAKALAQDTPIIFLDEPTAHLDLPNKIDIMLLLRHLSNDMQKTILLSTHELELAIQTADKIWMMQSSGIQKGVPEDMILENKIQSNFYSKQFSFNNKTGGFEIKYTGNKTICLNGDDPVLLFWTKRALLRAGYVLTEDAYTRITVTEKPEWIIYRDNKTEKRYNIENLLFTLRQ